jgi:hypothetical protein
MLNRDFDVDPDTRACLHPSGLRLLVFGWKGQKLRLPTHDELIWDLTYGLWILLTRAGSTIRCST